MSNKISVKPMTDASFANSSSEEQFESLVRTAVQHQNRMAIRLRLADRGGRTPEGYQDELNAEVTKRTGK